MERATNDSRYRQAMADLDLTGQAVASGATIAPDFVMRSVIAMRQRLERHTPWIHRRNGLTCSACAHPWPCPDVRADFAVLGVEPDGED